LFSAQWINVHKTKAKLITELYQKVRT